MEGVNFQHTPNITCLWYEGNGKDIEAMLCYRGAFEYELEKVCSCRDFVSLSILSITRVPLKGRMMVRSLFSTMYAIV